MPFSKVSALPSVIYPVPSTLTFNLLFLALVIVLSISLNLFLLAFTHFGNFNSSGCSLQKLINSVNNAKYHIKCVIFILIICTISFILFNSFFCCVLT